MTTTTTTFNNNQVTFEQINKCHRIIEDATGNPFYMVESEHDSLTEYKVEYHEDTRKFTCTCPCGLQGFASVRNASGYCKHVRWAVAAAVEDKKELLSRRVAEANDIESSPEYQAEYRAYVQEQEDIKAGYEHFDSCVPQAR